MLVKFLVGVLMYFFIGLIFGILYELILRKELKEEKFDSPWLFVMYWPFFIAGYIVGLFEK